MQIKLDLFSKNWAIYEGSPYRFSCEHTPRVGEMIDVGPELIREPSTFIVLDVTWKNQNGELIPTLKCHQWLEGDRQFELEEHGWM